MSIEKKREIAQETFEVTFRIQDDQTLDFLPGQYIRLCIPSVDAKNPKGNIRDFTLLPTENPSSFAIAFRNSSGAFKRALTEFSQNIEVLAYGPLGHFTLPEDPAVPILFMATGIGITPAIAMLHYMQRHQLATPFHVVYVNSDPESAAYLREIQEITEKNERIKLLEIYGRPEISFLQKNLFPEKNTLCYLCGLPQFVLDFSEKMPVYFDISEENIRTEEYVGLQTDSLYYPPFPEGKAEEQTLDDLVRKVPFAQALLRATDHETIIALTDKTGTILFVNQKFIEISKYSKEELIGQNHRILKSGFHPPSFYKELWKTISSGKMWHGEFKNRAKDGSFYWVSSTLIPVFDDENHITHYLTVRILLNRQKDLEKLQKATFNILRDLSEEKEKLSRLTQRFHWATDAAHMGIWEWNPQTNTCFANDMFYELFPLPRESPNFSFEAWKELFHPDDREGIVRLLEEKIRDPAQNRVEFMIRSSFDKAKMRFFKVFAHINYAHETTVAGVVWEITSEKELDQMKTDFISFASHQLRTPLTSVKWYSEMLLKGDSGPLNEPQKEILNGLYASVNQMNDLIIGLLNISRTESSRLNIRPVPIRPLAFIRDCMDRLRSPIETKQIHMDLDIPENLPDFMMDPEILYEIYQNIILNAVKYSPEKTAVTIRMEVREEEILTHIQDKGYGIPEQAQQKIFQRFFRADNVAKKEINGTGLGLYLTKLLVELCKGKIWFESTEGQGTTFHLSFPLKGLEAREGTVNLNA